jgi:transcription elongation factor GreB
VNFLKSSYLDTLLSLNYYQKLESLLSLLRITMAQKNYITPAGLARLNQELYTLKHDERPQVTQQVAWAASNGDRSENGDYIYGKKKLREIDKRIEFLSKHIDEAFVIDPLTVTSDYVQFGATVTLCDEDDNKKTYSIVGSDEVDVLNGKISWLSPLGSALINAKAKEGDWVTYNTPKGELGVEVLKVCFKAIA